MRVCLPSWILDSIWGGHSPAWTRRGGVTRFIALGAQDRRASSELEARSSIGNNQAPEIILAARVLPNIIL